MSTAELVTACIMVIALVLHEQVASIIIQLMTFILVLGRVIPILAVGHCTATIVVIASVYLITDLVLHKVETFVTPHMRLSRPLQTILRLTADSDVVAVGITLEILGFGGVRVNVIATGTIIFVMTIVMLAVFMSTAPLVTAVILVIAYLSDENQRLVFFVMSLTSIVHMGKFLVPSFAVDDLPAAVFFIAAVFARWAQLLGHQVPAITAAILGQAVPLFTSERLTADSNVMTVGITLELALVVTSRGIPSISLRAVFVMPLEVVFAVFMAAAHCMTARLSTIAFLPFEYEDSVAIRVTLL